jgi:hypothetical protein
MATRSGSVFAPYDDGGATFASTLYQAAAGDAVNGVEIARADPRVIYLPLMNRLAADPAGGNFRILGFQYPNDESLARSGKFLKREMLRVCAAAKHVDFVCHSAGGLVFRQYAEVEGGEFHHVYFQGTPHYGSDLAALRSLLEATQFLSDLKLGYDGALQQAILDGHGQMSYDLQPDSLFLRQLNAPRDKPGREGCIYCGQASSRCVRLMESAVAGARVAGAAAEDRREIAKFGLPGLENSSSRRNREWRYGGDAESAKLSGGAVFTHPLHHTELPPPADRASGEAGDEEQVPP